MPANPHDNSTMPASDSSAVLVVDVQCVLENQELEELDAEEPPSRNLLTAWAQAAYTSVTTQPAEVTIRLVDEAEMIALNRDYRGQDKATNVLSFVFDVEPEIESGLEFPLLGDIVICHPVILDEARTQKKTSENHYAHMVTHGILHLCGYDHQDDTGAAQMEALEAKILGLSGIDNPYK